MTGLEVETTTQHSNDGDVQVNVDGEGLATVTLAASPGNSLSGCLLSSISRVMKKLNGDKLVKGIIITSSLHGRAFSFGLNFYEMLDKTNDQLAEYWGKVHEVFLDVYGCNKPVIAAINGFAPAGGCALALMTDYRVIMEGTTIGLNSVSFSASSPQFWADLMTAAIGKRQAELALLQGTMFSSRQALQIGVVDEVCDVDKVYDRARKQLKKMVKIPQPAFMLTKQLFRKETIDNFVKNMQAETTKLVGFINQPPVQASIRAVLEKLA